MAATDGSAQWFGEKAASTDRSRSAQRAQRAQRERSSLFSVIVIEEQVLMFCAIILLYLSIRSPYGIVLINEPENPRLAL